MLQLLAEGKRARAALLLEKSQILEHRLSKEAEAQATTAECLALDPEDVTLLVQLERRERSEPRDLVGLYAHGRGGELIPLVSFIDVRPNSPGVVLRI